jgi:hypothetical protein
MSLLGGVSSKKTSSSAQNASGGGLNTNSGGKKGKGSISPTINILQLEPPTLFNQDAGPSNNPNAPQSPSDVSAQWSPTVSGMAQGNIGSGGPTTINAPNSAEASATSQGGALGAIPVWVWIAAAGAIAVAFFMRGK